jgi:hypothetical protein
VSSSIILAIAIGISLPTAAIAQTAPGIMVDTAVGTPGKVLFLPEPNSRPDPSRTLGRQLAAQTVARMQSRRGATQTSHLKLLVFGNGENPLQSTTASDMRDNLSGCSAGAAQDLTPPTRPVDYYVVPLTCNPAVAGSSTAYAAVGERDGRAVSLVINVGAPIRVGVRN